MRITKWGEYGILCCIQLVGTDGSSEILGASAIADAVGIPLDYTQQILQRLRKAGVITSTRGPRGGYSLAHSPEQTTLKDILYAAEGSTFEVLCDGNGVYDACSAHEQACGLQAIWRELQASIDQLLETKNLRDLVKNHSAPGTNDELVTIGKGNLQTPEILTE